MIGEMGDFVKDLTFCKLWFPKFLSEMFIFIYVAIR